MQKSVMGVDKSEVGEGVWGDGLMEGEEELVDQAAGEWCNEETRLRPARPAAETNRRCPRCARCTVYGVPYGGTVVPSSAVVWWVHKSWLAGGDFGRYHARHADT